MANENKKTPRAVTLSVCKGFEEELNYLNQQPNKSYYVWNLIRQDIAKSKEDNQILDVVKSMLQGHIESNSVVRNNKQLKPTVDNSNKELLKKSAMALFE